MNLFLMMIDIDLMYKAIGKFLAVTAKYTPLQAAYVEAVLELREARDRFSKHITNDVDHLYPKEADLSGELNTDR